MTRRMSNGKGLGLGEEFYTHEFENGLTLVAQRMEQVSSTAATIAVPMGASRDPDACAGSAAVASYWMLRGAGQHNSRQLNDALDALGCQHHEEPRSQHLVLSAAQLGRNLPEVLRLYGDILRRPQLAEETFGPSRELVSQALDGLEDEPMRKCNVLIRERFYPQPLGRNALGTKESLAAMDASGLRKHLEQHLSPNGTIIGIAGQFDWAELLEVVHRCFGDWAGAPLSEVSTTPPAGGQVHLTKDSAQVQIALAYPAVTIADDRYYVTRVAQMVLSGGMSARLFTEVREKRALVYAVMARYHSLKDQAGIFVYAGTTPDRAQETLDVTVEVLRGLSENLTAEELARARTQLKSALVMQGESTSARSGALVADQYHLGRLRGLSEIADAIDAVTVDQVRQYVRAFPAEDLIALIIGPKQLDTRALS